MRLTVFPTVAPDVESVTWWKEVIGEPPETKTIQPRTASLQEVGTIRGGLCKLSLECQPQRIDWLFFPSVKGTEITDFPTFIDLEGGLKLVDDLLEHWLASCPASKRLALGVVLIQRTESKKAAYELLKKYLPSVQLDAEKSSEFSYQINRPRLSNTVDGLSINRLSKWSAIKLSGMMIQLGIGQGEPTAKFLKSSTELNGCRLELDINTSPQVADALSKESLNSLVHEMKTMAMEIASEGDKS